MFRNKYGIVSADVHGIIHTVNEDMCRMFGFEERELVGQNLSVICPEPYRTNHQMYVDRYEQTKVPRVLGRSRQVEGARKNGTVFPLTLSVSRSVVDSMVMYVGVIEEVVPDVLVLTVNASGVVDKVKGRGAIFGYQNFEYVGMHLAQLLHAVPEHDMVLHGMRDIVSVRDSASRERALSTSALLSSSHNMQVSCKSGSELTTSVRVTWSTRREQFHLRLQPITQGMELIMRVDVSGAVISANEHAEILLGYSRDAIVGRQLRRIIPSPYAQVFDMLKEAASPSAPAVLDRVQEESVLVRCADRSVYHATCVSTVFCCEGANTLQVILTNLQSADRQFSSVSAADTVALGDHIGQYVVQGDLGSGFFGTVRKAMHLITQQPVAIKTLRKAQYLEVKMMYPPREVELLRVLRHPHIMRMYEDIPTEDRLYLITEHIDGDDFFAYLEKKDRLTEVEMRNYFRQMVSAVMYMHDVGIVHRDLKPENMLMTRSGVIKVIDLGLGNFFRPGELLNTFCGSLDYAAPELWIGRRYFGPPVDVWSLGVVLYLAVTGYLPFGNTTRILNGLFTWPEDVVPSPKLRDLVARMLIVDASKRITMEEIRTHPWTTEGYVEPVPYCSAEKTPIVVNEKVMSLLSSQAMPVAEIRKSVLADTRNSLSSIYYLAEKSYYSSQTDSAVRAGCSIQ